MKKQRPVNLDISTFKLPLTAWMSITHRATGVILFAATAMLLWMLDTSLSSAQGFADIKSWLDGGLVKFIVWAILALLAYHVVVGLKHYLMDMGIGEELETGHRASQIGLVLAIVLIILAGVWVW